ncbi:TonB-dependent receptor [Flavilitoribacter nigricans]|nr:TonB-dependent receptor [Flavilitoribacter nigricans]
MKSLLISLSLLLLASGAIGQEVSDTILLDDVIVIPSPFSNYVYNDNAFGNLHWSSEAKKLKEASFLNESLLMAPSVHVNDGTTNPIGQDIQIRGFKTSPLYGLSQEVAVYADGVKKNDLLGDAVFWDLMPTFAMNQTQVFVGSQPLFGLNALGGTINYTSKSGFTNPGGALALNYGSFNRMNAIAEYGANNGRFGYYVGANLWQEDGWRDHSESDVTNVFSKLSYQQGKNVVDFSLQYANTQLLGNGALPLELLDRKEWRDQIFTHPDRTENELAELNASWQYRWNDLTSSRLVLSYKDLETDILNGDESPFRELIENGSVFLVLGDDDDEGEEIDADDYAMDRNGERIEATDDNSEAILNKNQISQQSFSAAYSVNTKWQAGAVFWEIQSGLSYRVGRAHYQASGELGDFDESRAATGSGQSVSNFDTDVITDIGNLHATTGISAVINNDLAIQLSGAYNHSSLILRDQLGTALNGDHRFSNFSGALTAYYLAGNNWMFHGAVNTSTRNPTAVEVSCADPDAPCRLPNAFLSDPPLETVRAVTTQAGIAYQNKRFRFSSTGFITGVSDDIYFVSAGPLRGSGFFDNIGKTRRMGWENSVSWQIGERWNILLNYTLLDATFRDQFKIAAPNHPRATDGEITVMPGDRLALIPRHNVNGKISYQLLENLELEWTQLYNSAQYIRGDEGNELDQIPGFFRQDVAVRYAVQKHLLFWAKVKNLTNVEYHTFGLLGEADEAGELLEVELENNVFAGPAPPRYVELGARYTF